jgi:hypothetical protein
VRRPEAESIIISVVFGSQIVARKAQLQIMVVVDGGVVKERED